MVSPKAYGNKYACFKGEDVASFLMDDDAFDDDSVSLISIESGSTNSSTSSARRRSGRCSKIGTLNELPENDVSSERDKKNLTEELIVKPIHRSSPSIMKTPKRKLSTSSTSSSNSSKKSRTEPRRRSVSFAQADVLTKSASKVTKQKVVPTVVLKRVENRYMSFRNQTPESVERPTSRRSLGESFPKDDTPRPNNRSLRQRK